MLDNLELMKLRAGAADSDRQHNRMIMDKLRSMHRALLYSYQAAWVRKDAEDEQWVRALINPDNLKFDYDEKYISIDFDYGYKPGDTFEWGKNTGSHWIILKPEMTELAYFRAACRRCKYLTAVDPETHKEFSQWVAVRGPVETKLNHIQKTGLVADVPNLTLDIYMADTEANRRTFERYKRFEFDGRFWKVQAPDFISTPGIFEIQAEEDYECREDEMFITIEDEQPKEEVPPTVNEIFGDSSVKPYEEHTFSLKFQQDGEWTITLSASKNKELADVLEYTINEDNSITVTWYYTKSGSYILHYGDMEKTVLVESMF